MKVNKESNGDSSYSGFFDSSDSDSDAGEATLEHTDGQVDTDTQLDTDMEESNISLTSGLFLNG